MPQTDEYIQDDPYLILGYGVNAYFDMLGSLSFMFFCISIFSLPIFYLYGSHRAFSDYRTFQIARYTIGNMGGSSIFCQQSRWGKNEFTITCPNESIIDSR